MIIKSYEVNKKAKDLPNNNFYLLYGENVGLKKDLRELIINTKNKKAEYISFYENDILTNEENFYNSFYSGSLFSNKKIITINDCSDKITKHIEKIFDKNLEDILLIIYSNILPKKSKLRNLFEKSKKAVCIACYLDNDSPSRVKFNDHDFKLLHVTYCVHRTGAYLITVQMCVWCSDALYK